MPLGDAVAQEAVEPLALRLVGGPVRGGEENGAGLGAVLAASIRPGQENCARLPKRLIANVRDVLWDRHEGLLLDGQVVSGSPFQMRFRNWKLCAGRVIVRAARLFAAFSIKESYWMRLALGLAPHFSRKFLQVRPITADMTLRRNAGLGAVGWRRLA